ncbi:EpsG family protein, partial [Vibrio cyclitrophicus]
IIVSLLELNKVEQNITNVFCFFIIIALSLLVALRVDVGTDFSSYIGIFDRVNDYLDSGVSGLETGFISSISLFKIFGLNVHYHFGFFTLLSLALILFVACRETKFVAFVLLIYFCDLFFYYNLSGFRQSIAMGIVFLSFIFLKDRKATLFVITIILAATFHKPAIISLILYPLINNFKDKYFYCVCLSIPIFVQVLVVSGVFDFIDSLSYFRSTSLYVSDGYNNSDIVNLIKGSIKRLLPIILVALMFFLKMSTREIFKSTMFKIYFFALMTYLSLYYSYPDLTVRLTSYWFLFMALTIAIVLQNIKPKYHFLFAVIIYIHSFVSIYTYLSLDVYNYKTIGIF